MLHHRVAAGLLVPLAAALAAPAPASAARAGMGACHIAVDVRFDSMGSFQQTGGRSARCTGRVGRSFVDSTPVAASVHGLARHGIGACSASPISGGFKMKLRRMVTFGAGGNHKVTARWTATGVGPSVLRGHGNVNGVPINFIGTTSFTPAAGGCAAGGFSPGRLRMDFDVTSDEAAPLRPRRAHG